MTNTANETQIPSARDVHGIAAAILEPISRAQFGADNEADARIVKAIEERVIAGSHWRRRIVVECLIGISDGHGALDVTPGDLLCSAFDWRAKHGISWLHEHPEYISCAREVILDTDASPDLDGFLSATEAAASIIVRDALGELLENALDWQEKSAADVERCENCQTQALGDCPECFAATGKGCEHGEICGDCEAAIDEAKSERDNDPDEDRSPDSSDVADRGGF